MPPVEPPQFPDAPPDGSVEGPPAERLLPPGQLVDDRPPLRATRKPLALWDRTKFLLLAVALFWFFVWALMADDPILPFRDAVRDVSHAKWWLFLVAWLEIVRQVHYVISEHSAAYHRFWTEKVFGRWETRIGRLDDWNRYRLARALKWVLAVVVVAIVVGAITHSAPATALIQLPSHAIAALPMALQLVFIMLIGVLQFVAIFWFMSKGGVDVYFPDDIQTRFTDVWGQDSVLEHIKENMVFLEAPATIEAKGGYVPTGILLWGPPGTGKTLMAEAVAGETGKPFVFVDPGAFINMFMGVGILKVKSLFRKLRKLALRYGGVIVFFDEADSLGNRGALAGGGPGVAGFSSPAGIFDHGGCNGAAYLSESARAQLFRAGLQASPGVEPPRRLSDRIIAGMGGDTGTLQALLTELSGLKKPRGFINRVVRRTLGMRPKPPPKYRILVMMATNMPQALDEALLRPGRIDRIYKVGYPSKDGRKRTYQGYLDKITHELSDEHLDKLATITPYATGATIKDLVNEALILAIRDGRDVVTWPDVLRAKQLKQHGPPDDAEYIDRERHATAIHEACHAVVTYRTRAHVELDMATIERRGEVGGFVAWIPPEDQMFNWRSEYESDLMATLASLAGERLFFDGDNTNGVGGDLASATRLATLMEGFWGMGSTLASHGVQRELGVNGGPPRRPGEKDREDEILEALGSRIESNLERLLERAREILEDNAIVVLAVAHALETHKTLSGDDLVAVIEGRQGPVVDGRPYHTERFATMALAYHEAALRAHHDHSAVPVPLPSLNGHRPHPRVLVDAANPDELA